MTASPPEALKPKAQPQQKEAQITQIIIAEATIANALPAEHHIITATVRNADTLTSTRDGWEKTASNHNLFLHYPII